MPLAGKQLTIQQALALDFKTGWRRRNLRVSVAVMTAESGRWTEAYHINDDGSKDRGLFQINDKAHPDFSDSLANTPSANAKFAYTLWGLRGWQPWSAYNSGAYKKYSRDVYFAWLRFWSWRRLIPTIEEVVDA